MYPIMTFPTTVNEANGATVVISPNLYANNCITVDIPQQTLVKMRNFLLFWVNSLLILDGEILSIHIIIRAGSQTTIVE